jgi:hypothetical protein
VINLNSSFLSIYLFAAQTSVAFSVLVKNYQKIIRFFWTSASLSEAANRGFDAASRLRCRGPGERGKHAREAREAAIRSFHSLELFPRWQIEQFVFIAVAERLLKKS